MQNYYEILGVSPSASDEEIKTAYRERVKERHPDRFSGKDEEITRILNEKTALINEAYRILSDPDERKKYDEAIKLEHEIKLNRDKKKRERETQYSYTNPNPRGSQKYNYRQQGETEAQRRRKQQNAETLMSENKYCQAVDVLKSVENYRNYSEITALIAKCSNNCNVSMKKLKRELKKQFKLNKMYVNAFNYYNQHCRTRGSAIGVNFSFNTDKRLLYSSKAISALTYCSITFFFLPCKLFSLVSQSVMYFNKSACFSASVSSFSKSSISVISFILFKYSIKACSIFSWIILGVMQALISLLYTFLEHR